MAEENNNKRRRQNGEEDNSSLYDPQGTVPTGQQRNSFLDDVQGLQPVQAQSTRSAAISRAYSPPISRTSLSAAASPRQIATRPEFLEPFGDVQTNFATAILSTNEAVNNLVQSGIAQGRPTQAITQDLNTLLSLAGKVVSENQGIMTQLLEQRDERERQEQARRDEEERQVVINQQTADFLAQSTAVFNSGHFQQLTPQQQSAVLNASLILLQRNITKYEVINEQGTETQQVEQNISGLFGAVINSLGGVLSNVREHGHEYAQNTLYGILAVVLAGSYLPALQSTTTTGITGLLIQASRILHSQTVTAVRNISVPMTVIYLLLQNAGFKPQINRLGGQCSAVASAIGTEVSRGFQELGELAGRTTAAGLQTCSSTIEQVQNMIGESLATMAGSLSGNYFVSDIVEGLEYEPSVSTFAASRTASSIRSLASVQSIRDTIISQARSVRSVVDQNGEQLLGGNLNPAELEAVLVPLADQYAIPVLETSRSSRSSSIDSSDLSDVDSEANGFGWNFGGKLKQKKQTKKQRKTKKRQLKLKGGRKTRKIRKTKKPKKIRRTKRRR